MGKKCSIEGCDRPYCAKGYCQPHYDKERNNGDPLYERPATPVRFCSIEGCDAVHVANGYCQHHWGKNHRYGDPLHRTKYDMSESERFWSRVAETSDEDACWLWTGRIDRDGYGRTGNQTNQIAHRYAYIEAHGSISDGLVLDHQCHNDSLTCEGGASCVHRKCVNPAHLVQATGGVNVLASRHTSASKKKAQVRCIHGHKLSGANLYVTPKGMRTCRTCQVIRKRNRRAKHNGRPLESLNRPSLFDEGEVAS